MKNTLQKYGAACAILYPLLAPGISMVYNFRIAQITKQPIFEESKHKRHNVMALPFDQYRQKYTGPHTNFIGGLGTYIYTTHHYYFRIDGAVSHIHEVTDHVTTFSGTDTDDILFTFGRNFKMDQRQTMTFSGLFGVPTHKIFGLQHVDFGYGQVGAGIQIDGSYKINQHDGIIYGARYIYFVPRTALDLEHQKYQFTLGNLGDLLIAYKNDQGPYGIEIGYTLRADFGAHISPALDDTVEKTNYIRKDVYLVYKYRFSKDDTFNRLLLYGAYGYDRSAKNYGNKHIVTIWFSWNVGF